MINFPSSVSIYFCVLPVDMRRSFDSLAEIVRNGLGADPQSGHLFVFRNKQEDCIKVLYWDRDGYALWYKRLEKGNFKLPTTSGGTLELNAGEFSMLLGGFDLEKIQRQQRWQKSRRAV